MKLASSLMVGAIIGLGAHFHLLPLIRRDCSGLSMAIIARYTVGVLIAAPIFGLCYRFLNGAVRLERAMAAYFLAFLSVGAGAVFGHWWRPE